MGPAFETFLSVLLPVLVAIGVVAYVFRDSFKRLARYFQAWRLRDAQLEAEDAACRLRALSEISDTVSHGDDGEQHEQAKI